MNSGDEVSPYSVMMRNPLILTPIQAPRFKSDACFDGIDEMTDEFKNVELSSGVTPMSTWCANRNPKSSCDSVNIESSDSSCLFTSAKYFQAFGSEPKNEITWDGIIDMNEGNSQQSTDISSRSSSEGSSLCISSSRSVSISPANELSETALVDSQRTNLRGHSSSKNIHVKLESFKNCRKSNNHDYYGRRTQRKNRGNVSRKNRWHRSCKGSNLRTSNNQRQSYGANMKRFVSMCKQKTQIEKSTLGKATAKTKKNSQKRIPNKDVTSTTFEIFTHWLEQNMITHKGMFFAFVTDQEGSRFLQEHLILATPDWLWRTFSHLKPDFVAMSHDVFGNYVAQKYLELGCDKLLGAVVERLQSSILSPSMGIYGCRVVQKLLECASYEHKQVVVQQLAGSIIKCVYDQNGNHVVQKMIQCLNPNEIGFVVDEIAGHTFNLSMHPYGSRVLQRLLEKISWRKAKPLLNEIKQHIVILSKNQYGNYIVQWIVKHYSMERRDAVSKLIGHVAQLSKEKFASNVIEMAFRRSSQADLRELAEELFQDGPENKGTYPTLALLLNDEFGNYVVQTLLESSCGAFRQRLLRSLDKCAKSNKIYGKNLLMKVGQMLRK